MLSIKPTVNRRRVSRPYVEFYYGDSIEALLEVFYHDRFLLGPSRSLWVTDSFSYALGLSKASGCGLVYDGAW